MDLKKIGIILVFVLIVVCLGYLMYSMFFSSPAPRPSQEEIGVEEIEEEGIEIEGVKVPAVEEETIIPKVKVNKEETELKKIAQSFVERFGSYSNQSNYENAEDLKIFMSSKMRGWAEDLVSSSKAEKKDTSIYFGVTTRALKSEIIALTPQRAEVLVSCQRQEARETRGNTNIYYQDISLKFVKVGGDWKVDEARWKERK